MGVLPGVGFQFVGQGPYPPIGQLEMLVGHEIAESLHQISQRQAGIAQLLRRLVSVEHVYHVEGQIPLQPLHVHIGPVKYLKKKIQTIYFCGKIFLKIHAFDMTYFYNTRFRKYFIQYVQPVSQSQSIYQIILLARRYLHETSYAHERPVRVVFQIDREFFTAPQRLDQFVDLFGTVNLD